VVEISRGLPRVFLGCALNKTDQAKPYTVTMNANQGEVGLQALIEQTKQLLQTNPSQAAEVAKQILELAQTPHQRALGLMHLGWAERSLLQLHEGTGHAKEALEIFWQHHDLENHTFCLILLAGLEVLLAEHESAYGHMMKALEQSRQIGHKFYEARANNALGALFDWYSNNGLALEHLLEAMGLLDELGERDSMLGCMILSNIGAMYYRQGDHQKSLLHYQSSLLGFERLGAGLAAQTVRLNIAESLIKLGQHATAQEHLEKDIQNIRMHQELELESFALRTLATAQIGQGKHQVALVTLQNALAIAEQHEWLEERGLAHLGLGKVYFEMGQAEKALMHLEAARTGLLHSSIENQLEVLQHMVAVKETMGDDRLALTLYREWSQMERKYRETHAERHTKSLMLRFEMAQAQRQTQEVLSRNRDLEVAIAEKERLTAELERLSFQDSLTNLYNRRYLEQHFSELLAVSEAQGRKVALIVLDIDHFKRVNDQFSHLIGDRVLHQFAQILLQNLRPSDVCVRFGGEEFLVILSDAQFDSGKSIAERLRQNIQAHPWQRMHTHLEITTSIGLALSQSNETVEQLMARADQALYRAKQLGRNQVFIAPEKVYT
jgi:diguanylate cyclase (GGDEF)-like protein